VNKVYLVTKDDLTAAMASFAASVGASTASADDGTPVGRVVLDSVLRPGYVKANGATLTNATVDYPRLVAFVRDNPELLAADATAQAANLGLYVYMEDEDTLTLPNYMNRVLQCGESVNSVKAGLPNITGSFIVRHMNTDKLLTDHSTLTGPTGVFYAGDYGAYMNAVSYSGTTRNALTWMFDASRCNSAYGASSTVQPPAITLIPQIRC